MTSLDLKQYSFIHGRHLNNEKSVIFRQFACMPGCVQSMAKIDFLLEQLVKFVFKTIQKTGRNRYDSR